MIKIEGLTKSYHGKTVLSDVTFTAENGAVTGFVGPNGAGKSTTMRIVSGLELPDSGTALIDGEPFANATCPGRRMGIYLGNSYLPLHLTGKEYLEYACTVADVSTSKIPELIKAVELEGSEDKTIANYSLGMKQRIGLAAAVAGDPKTLMLDEPVNGLDPMGVQWLRGMLRDQANKGVAVLLSSHLLSELELVADRVVMLDQGKVVTQGTIADLGKSGGPHVAIHTSDDTKLAELLRGKGNAVDAQAGNLLVYNLRPRDVAKMAFEAGLDVDYLEEKRESLEEVFMSKASETEKGGE